MGKTCSTYGRIQTCIQFKRGDLRERDFLGTLGRRWEDNIKMDLKEVGCDFGDLLDIAQDRDLWRAYVRAVMKFQVP